MGQAGFLTSAPLLPLLNHALSGPQDSHRASHGTPVNVWFGSGSIPDYSVVVERIAHLERSLNNSRAKTNRKPRRPRNRFSGVLTENRKQFV